MVVGTNTLWFSTGGKGCWKDVGSQVSSSHSSPKAAEFRTLNWAPWHSWNLFLLICFTDQSNYILKLFYPRDYVTGKSLRTSLLWLPNSFFFYINLKILIYHFTLICNDALWLKWFLSSLECVYLVYLELIIIVILNSAFSRLDNKSFLLALCK